ncbi:MAG: putative DNA-binding protein [Clostridia bacterium]|nr:putative DNA-binding protein [Clostridium sp.]MBS6252561.1 putative DNA-binding protein [Clostridium sp.]
MEKNVKISVLCDLYGNLLTEKQFEFIDDYYNKDLSLSEIAENKNITRQAVRDNIKKGEKKLFEYEEKLLFMKRMLKQEKKIENILLEITKIQKEYSDEQVASLLEHIKNELNCIAL